MTPMSASKSECETFDSELNDYQETRQKFWDTNWDSRKTFSRYYHARMHTVYRNVILEGTSVLEIGCGTGSVLAASKPSIGVGLDFSVSVIEQAKKQHPHLEFVLADAHGFDLGNRKFDYIILSDLVNELWDVQTVLEGLRPYCKPETRVIINFFSHLWNPPLRAVRAMGLATPQLPQNWLTVHDMRNLLELSGFQPLRNWTEVIVPTWIPLLSDFANRYLAKIVPFRWLSLTHLMVARPVPKPLQVNPTVSVIVAARNESGHIEELMTRIPEMGGGTEIVFVEGNSTDDTYEAIERAIAAHPERNAKLFKQKGKGKGDAVRLGFEQASGDILMILDADITVPPEDLPRFYDLIASGSAEFVNGVRLVYPMQEEAMRFFNLIGNKFFSQAFSWLLGQPIRDTLCGTKVLRKADYNRIADNRSFFGDFDPFGDFDLLFGAARLNLKIQEVPIRYRARRYGETNISRWRHGWLLLKMVAFAARRIKFI
ncbi:glycosyl transferase family protein [Roseibium sp. TrichSKD4]|uniref:bifunctional class I SAM-dependent methyltransferase/glycosyltransferase family 2 protein n=1 Tax=Roseibium sp. TrichSKD4 TaxID=744980 RepID=UPI0001E565B0|nr:bifunctional class I SAM-dependent methyltransferase/glycosyltransferase family 2 protein [Roseibium sp. TrichSKD4]EFO33340.1 glycosyl transferase family protein [Roseibium sp. TrichSKD4]